MTYNRASDPRRGGPGDGRAPGQRRRMRPTLLALEDRRLLSTIVVNNPTDTPVAGQIDLRQAIALANTNGGTETITFDSTVFKTPQTITLTGSQLELSDTTGTETITGPKAGVTVNGGGTSRVFQVDAGVTASISGLTITGGNDRRQRRRPVQRWRHGHADQLHRQRQLRQPPAAAACSTLRRHDHADQLHRQRQLRRPQRRRPVQPTTARPR